MNISTSQDIGQEICKRFNLPTTTTAISISMKANEPAIMQVTHHMTDSLGDHLHEVITNYKLVKLGDPNWPPIDFDAMRREFEEADAIQRGYVHKLERNTYNDCYKVESVQNRWIGWMQAMAYIEAKKL